MQKKIKVSKKDIKKVRDCSWVWKDCVIKFMPISALMLSLLS